jgi:hypothetical protein
MPGFFFVERSLLRCFGLVAPRLRGAVRPDNIQRAGAALQEMDALRKAAEQAPLCKAARECA